MSRRFDPNTPPAVQIRAVRDAYLMATPDKPDTAYSVLTSAAGEVDRITAALGGLLAACELMDPSGICSTNRNIPDSMVVSIDLPLGDLRQFRAAIAAARSA